MILGVPIFKHFRAGHLHIETSLPGKHRLNYTVLFLHPLKTDNKIQICKISKKCFAQAISYREFRDHIANSVDQDEVVHYEPPHLDL